ncbi:hypothetical protein D8B26_001648 [Coccidioides posadasii str. Silveira]|uniref:Uncharacterized protein n=2 Tax=Coccidioides posadasii TaxID=199306 RepID=E9CVX3_COCPS|nr:hypothetical protein CPSG_01606 [Coccidioides posadasii str. Silveira]KMM64926.1 hypothetical protein CPAG_01278 [Coccidioides posadasii RMSCC 3488]QVM06942.1 hypothetical protein D8B26_001648 [Coccidioides posadasii str. Silveira]
MASAAPRGPPFVRNGGFTADHSRSQSFAEGTGPTRSRLRRTVSIRGVNAHLDSSESVPSEHSSLHYGFLTSLDGCDDDEPTHEDQKREKEDSFGRWQPGVAGGKRRGVYRSVTHSGWRPHVLDPISEHPSFSTLQSSASPLSRELLLSTGVSFRSRLSFGASVLGNRYGDKVYSLDDLDIPSFRPKFPFSSLPAYLRRSSRLSSSYGSFSEQPRLSERFSPVQPLEPIYPPPIRSVTPPGLPSFGTPEAVRYRLSSQTTPGSGNDVEVEDCTCCFLGLPRFLALSSSSPSRVPGLPAGAIARADDGTLVRGRFGIRQSGHGVGAGCLENHPFSREPSPAACIRDTKDNGSVNQGRRQGSLCCNNAAATPPQTTPGAFSLRLSSASKPSSGSGSLAPRRVHFVDGTGPVDTTSVPLPSYIRHPPLVAPAPRVETSPPSTSSGMACTVAAATGNSREESTLPFQSVSGSTIPHPVGFSAAPPVANSHKSWEYLSFVTLAAECCGLWFIHHLNEGIRLSLGQEADDRMERQSCLNFREFWRRGKKASQPWIPAWGYRPASSR